MNCRLKAQVSDKISNDDDTIIRIGKKARSKLISGLNTHVEVWNNPFSDSRLYKVRQAFSEDLALLPRDEREMVFVSQHVFDEYVNSEGYINLSPKKTTCIGSDPEFAIFVESGGREYTMHAADVLAFESAIGSDGPLGELRADPGLTPKEHVDNLEKLIGGIYGKLDPNEYKCRILPFMNSKWTHLNEYTNNTISEKNSVLTCGGHIHFGLTQKTKNKEGINTLIVNIIDRLIAVCMHRVDMDMSIKRINEGGYGDLNDFRHRGFSLEYRGLSGTWLLYKDLATTVLSVVNSLVENITVRINNRFEDINDSNWNIEDVCSLDSDEESIENTVMELYPEIKPIIEEYPSDIFEPIFLENPNNTDTLRYVNKVIECLDSIIGTSDLEPFANLVIADYNKYKNLDPNFIENWAGGVSVFDHLNK
jgi:hypothetical protein